MNVAIFGGTFDPVHRGHLAVARAAQQARKLGRIYFVPADIPPHKQRQPVTPFHHRYAMLALALRDEPKFVPSLMEAPGEETLRTPSFTITTVRRFRALLPKRDRLFFIIGIDAFIDFPTWRQPADLLREIEFIVVSRPGYDLGQVASKLEVIGAGKAKVHLLPGVAEKISSTALRRMAASGSAATRYMDPAVVDYIRKEHLYGER